MIVTDAAFPYLVAQRGRIDALKHDRPAWEAAYAADLAETLANITPHLPARCGAILDVGGGMGGIDAMLSRHYGGLEVCILDGEADPAAVRSHAETFSHMGAARDFLAVNGVERFERYTPDLGEPRSFDLIVSFAAWCFHIEPAAYLPFVKACCHPGTILILDVRRGRPAWSADLHDAFQRIDVAHVSGKFERMVFRAR